jgi:hypothetical protein
MHSKYTRRAEHQGLVHVSRAKRPWSALHKQVYIISAHCRSEENRFFKHKHHFLLCDARSLAVLLALALLLLLLSSFSALPLFYRYGSLRLRTVIKLNRWPLRIAPHRLFARSVRCACLVSPCLLLQCKEIGLACANADWLLGRFCKQSSAYTPA